MKKKFYLTTPLYYVNDMPHLGHAYTTISADALARYHRLKGEEVFFLTGTDEHGMKIFRAAQKMGLSPQELADRMVKRFKELWNILSISYDDFIRTTEVRHTRVVEKVFKILFQKGEIYRGKYRGWYCTPCESFWLSSQLREGKFCPECGREVEELEEETFFFRLSRYETRLLDFLRDNPSFVLPPSRYRETVEFVRGGLKDLSVTRLNLSWGVPCPLDIHHSIYVWIDALLNYISAPGYLFEEERFQTLWPVDVHLIGKDILKFHSIIWPALLMALDLPLPKLIFAHGWWLSEGEKMSKSKGNVIDPKELAQKYGADTLRYFLLREVPFGEDGNLSHSLFEERINSDLANDLGNLLHRVLPLVERYLGGKIPSPSSLQKEDKKLIEKGREIIPKMDRSMDKLSFSEALSFLWELVRETNLYLDRCAPWRLFKNKALKRAKTVTYVTLETIRRISFLLFPFLPTSSLKMGEQIGLEEKAISSATLKEVKEWGKLPPGKEIKKGPPLFPRIED